MDTATIVGVVQESLFMILVFLALLVFAMIRGRHALVNLILGLYLAFLAFLKFPYFDKLLGSASNNALALVLIFAVFTTLTTILLGKLMATDPDEPAFEKFNKKVILSILGAILIMAYSYHALPVTDIITPGSPIQSLFAPEQNFFWWLLLPLVGLYFT
jgi:hypothetical protein